MGLVQDISKVTNFLTKEGESLPDKLVDHLTSYLGDIKNALGETAKDVAQIVLVTEGLSRVKEYFKRKQLLRANAVNHLKYNMMLFKSKGLQMNKGSANQKFLYEMGEKYGFETSLFQCGDDDFNPFNASDFPITHYSKFLKISELERMMKVFKEGGKIVTDYGYYAELVDMLLASNPVLGDILTINTSLDDYGFIKKAYDKVLSGLGESYKISISDLIVLDIAKEELIGAKVYG
jgi:hypothetical protein